MKRKQKWLLLMIFSLLILAGWGKKQVELLNDKKLIDLNAALGNCLLGAEDLIPDEGDKTQNPDAPSATPGPTVNPTPMPTVTPKATATPWPIATPTPIQLPQSRVIVIRVRDQNITYNSAEWTDIDNLKEQIQKDHSIRISFQLVDDYAEAHVYRRIMAILEELEAEIGIRYTID